MSLTTSYLPADTGVDLVELTVPALLARRAAEHPDRLALVGRRHGDGADVRLTYAELLTEAQHVATGLRTLAEPGDYIALWAPNIVEWPVIQYGAAMAGVILVALNPVLRPGELDYALEHSRATVLLHADVSRDYDMAAVARAAGDRHDGLSVVSLSERARWRRRDRPGRRRAGADRRRATGDAAVHLRHHRQPQGRAAAAPVAGQRRPADHGPRRHAARTGLPQPAADVPHRGVRDRHPRPAVDRWHRGARAHLRARPRARAAAPRGRVGPVLRARGARCPARGAARLGRAGPAARGRDGWSVDGLGHDHRGRRAHLRRLGDQPVRTDRAVPGADRDPTR